MSTGILRSDTEINQVYGFLEDYHLLERALNEYEIDTVFHVGAQAIVGTANRNPMSTFEAIREPGMCLRPAGGTRWSKNCCGIRQGLW